jgi:hypothetical protein
MRVTNGIPRGSSLLLPVGTVISVQTLKDFGSHDDLIGEAIVDVSSLGLNHTRTPLKVPLNSSEGDAGEIFIELSYADQQALFGLDMTSAVAREKESESSITEHVPNIVATCLQSVRTRGLDEEGIFRLSGGKGDKDKVKIGFDDPDGNVNEEEGTDGADYADGEGDEPEARAGGGGGGGSKFRRHIPPKTKSSPSDLNGWFIKVKSSMMKKDMHRFFELRGYGAVLELGFTVDDAIESHYCCWLEAKHVCDPIALPIGLLPSLTVTTIHPVTTLKV